MNDQNNNNQPLNTQPNPTVPNKDIFSANTIPQPEVEQIDKKKIIAQVGGSNPKFPKKILIILGALVLVSLILLLIKSVATRVNQTGKTTITWWSIEEDEAAVRPLIEEYKKQHPNVDIQFMKESQIDYRERLVSALEQGKGPDIYEFHNSWAPLFSSNLVPFKDDFSSIFYPVINNDLKSSKGFLGVPLEINGLALFINQDIFNAYGKSAPKTWDNLRDIAKQLTIRDANNNIKQAGVALGVTSNIDYWQNIFATLMLQNGADLTSPSGTNGESAIKFYTNFSKTDLDWDETLPNSTTYFANGLLAMYFGPYNEIFSIRKQNPNLHFNVAPIPQLPSQSSAVPSVSYAGYWVNGVSKSSSNVAAAQDFLKFMITQESLRTLYNNEIKERGYGNLYPRSDMQNELMNDSTAGPFIYEAGFARSWYLYANTFDGALGINTQISKPYSTAIDALNGSADAKSVMLTAQSSIQQVLATFGLFALPKATP